VVEPGDAPVKEREVIKDEAKFRRTRPAVPSRRLQGYDGAPRPLRNFSTRIDTDGLSVELREKMKNESSLQKRLKYTSV